MKANEFRIGNYHFYHIEDPLDERKEWDEVTQIEWDDLRLLSEFKDNPEFRPIPLTEEWLLKFGFHEIIDGNLRKGMLIVTKGSKGELTVTIRMIMIKTIKHVHQLQNLYFALTGEELTLA
jgi:hypothetical protein